MKPLQILVLEDDIDDAQIINSLLSKVYTVTLVNKLKKAKEIIITSKFDLAILDINIDGKLSGIEFGKYIQNIPNPIPFLFLTSMQSKSIFDQAKLTQPFTYLLKPFNDLELQYSIELAIEKKYGQEYTLRKNEPLISKNYLLVKRKNSICKLNFSDIEYISVEENYCTLYTLDLKYVVKKSLKKIKELLPHGVFEQIHRKFLINFDKVNEINLKENTVYLKSGFQITISDRYKKNLISRFNIIT